MATFNFLPTSDFFSVELNRDNVTYTVKLKGVVTTDLSDNIGHVLMLRGSVSSFDGPIIGGTTTGARFLVAFKSTDLDGVTRPNAIILAHPTDIGKSFNVTLYNDGVTKEQLNEDAIGSDEFKANVAIDKYHGRDETIVFPASQVAFVNRPELA